MGLARKSFNYVHNHPLLGPSEGYPYTRDLVELDRRWPLSHADHNFESVTTPLVLDVWKQMLHEQSDRVYCDYLLKGITSGFRIGFDYVDHECTI